MRKTLVPGRMGDRDSLLTQLKRARRALQILEEQKAGFGLRAPVDLELEIREKREEIEKLKARIELVSIQEENVDLRAQVQELQSALTATKQELQAPQEALEAKERELQAKARELQDLQEALDAKDRELQAAVQELTEKQEEIDELQARLQAQEKTPIAAATPKGETPAGDFQEDLGNGTILEMVKIPGGRFIMGAPESESESRDDERPQHRVTVPEFWLGKYPITQGQWYDVAHLPQVERELKLEPSKFLGENLPVEQVSWLDAVEFCARLSKKFGKAYRLPSEAEWEYACRAGTQTPFYFGNTITPDLANYNGNYTYGSGSKGEYREKTTTVGSFKPNAFGLFDMHGNVYEWCQDDWHGSYEGAPVDGSAWCDLENASKVMRGGSWSYIPRYCRSAYRFSGTRVFRNDPFGFRVCCDSPRT